MQKRHSEELTSHLERCKDVMSSLGQLLQKLPKSLWNSAEIDDILSTSAGIQGLFGPTTRTSATGSASATQPVGTRAASATAARSSPLNLHVPLVQPVNPGAAVPNAETSNSSDATATSSAVAAPSPTSSNNQGKGKRKRNNNDAEYVQTASDDDTTSRSRATKKRDTRTSRSPSPAVSREGGNRSPSPAPSSPRMSPRSQAPVAGGDRYTLHDTLLPRLNDLRSQFESQMDVDDDCGSNLIKVMEKNLLLLLDSEAHITNMDRRTQWRRDIKAAKTSVAMARLFARVTDNFEEEFALDLEKNR